MLTEEMKSTIKKGQCLIATANKEGIPNIGPKGSVIVVDDFTLAFGELVGQQTFLNLQNNPYVAIAAVDFDHRVGFRFVGTATLETSGPLFEKFSALFAKLRLPSPIAAVRVKLDTVFDLSAKNAGKIIAGQ
jgi:uncharacterized protein